MTAHVKHGSVLLILQNQPSVWERQSPQAVAEGCLGGKQVVHKNRPLRPHKVIGSSRKSLPRKRFRQGISKNLRSRTHTPNA